MLRTLSAVAYVLSLFSREHRDTVSFKVIIVSSWILPSRVLRYPSAKSTKN